MVEQLVTTNSATLVQQTTGNCLAALAFVKTIRPTALAVEVPQVEQHQEQHLAQPLAQPLEQIPAGQTHTQTTLLVLFHKTGVFNIQEEFQRKIAQALMLQLELTSLLMKPEKQRCRFKGRHFIAQALRSPRST